MQGLQSGMAMVRVDAALQSIVVGAVKIVWPLSSPFPARFQPEIQKPFQTLDAVSCRRA